MSKTGREAVKTFLEREIVGPRNLGESLDLASPLFFKNRDEAKGPWVDKLTGQEILKMRPRERYGSGVLSPLQKNTNGVRSDLETIQDGLDQFDSIPETLEGEVNIPDLVAEEITSDDEKGSSEDFELKSKKAWNNVSSMGCSFHLGVDGGGELLVRIAGGRYEQIKVQFGSDEKKADSQQSQWVEDWYVRRPYGESASFDSRTIQEVSEPTTLVRTLSNDSKDFTLEVRLLVRPWKDNAYICTLSVINVSTGGIEVSSLFQTNVQCEAKGEMTFKPYPESAMDFEMDVDDEAARMLYKNYPTFAIGHNIGIEWQRQSAKHLPLITLTSFPTYEAPSITPTLKFSEDSSPNLDMRLLSDSTQKTEIVSQLSWLADNYEKWIHTQQKIAAADPDIQESFKKSSIANLAECESALSRIKKGISVLSEDKNAFLAFTLANKAMLWQQYRSKLPDRKTIFANGQVSVDGPYPDALPDGYTSKWFPFQIAFILSVLESATNPDSVDRDLVDLIFFPTGGGKTEAYLGLAAFMILLKRIKDRDDNGTTVLMRYTLRLLTTQQFLRASALICALEVIRREMEITLGDDPISIGAWLGGDVTPNKNSAAIKALSEITKQGKNAANQFLVLKCPWCGALMGPLDSAIGKGDRKYFAAGYKVWTVGKKQFGFHCPDSRCEFAPKLPLQVVDENLYEAPPTLVIGTVDKFAQLAWESDARKFFGRDDSGLQIKSCPALIIQDEFHLISGPLGSMVGMYEGVIEELCTDRRGGKRILPKIVSSTATIRRFRAQARSIFARERVSLFPPPALDASDSFFAVWARDENGELSTGRMYLGINAPGLGSVQSVQVRVGAALSQAPMELQTDEERNPWWTNLWFFNSIRELSNTIPLYSGDIPNYLKDMKKRYSFETRHINNVHELTSRRKSHELPKILKELEENYAGVTNPNQKGIWDACLASNIIEVGIDIPRLSLMTVVSQPKSTAQYIQVSGRVGRRPEKSPGLVVSIYSSHRPRDLSHFEHFRSYHEKLYAQVEPTSVTPFAPPVIKRALRGSVVSYLRSIIPANQNPNQVDEQHLASALNLMRERALKVGISGADLDYLDDEILVIRKQWSIFRGDEWGVISGSPNGLMIAAGGDPSEGKYQWVIPVSMRNVDENVELEITRKYRIDQFEESDY